MNEKNELIMGFNIGMDISTLDENYYIPKFVPPSYTKKGLIKKWLYVKYRILKRKIHDIIFILKTHNYRIEEEEMDISHWYDRGYYGKRW